MVFCVSVPIRYPYPLLFPVFGSHCTPTITLSMRSQDIILKAITKTTEIYYSCQDANTATKHTKSPYYSCRDANTATKHTKSPKQHIHIKSSPYLNASVPNTTTTTSFLLATSPLALLLGIHPLEPKCYILLRDFKKNCSSSYLGTIYLRFVIFSIR